MRGEEGYRREGREGRWRKEGGKEGRGETVVPAAGREHSKMAEEKATMVVGKLCGNVSWSFLSLPAHTAVGR